MIKFHHSLLPLLVPIEEVTPWPDNPNNGDVDKIAESIRVNGMYQAICAQRSTGYILVGNHRYAALQELGSDQVPVIWLEVGDEEARRIAIADNRIGWPVHNLAPQRKLSWWFNMSMLQFALLADAGVELPTITTGHVQPADP